MEDGKGGAWVGGGVMWGEGGGGEIRRRRVVEGAGEDPPPAGSRGEASQSRRRSRIFIFRVHVSPSRADAPGGVTAVVLDRVLQHE